MNEKRRRGEEEEQEEEEKKKRRGREEEEKRRSSRRIQRYGTTNLEYGAWIFGMDPWFCLVNGLPQT